MATNFGDSDSCHPQAERFKIGKLVTNLTINFLRSSKRKTVALPQIDEFKCMGKYQIIHRRQKVLRFNSPAHLKLSFTKWLAIVGMVITRPPPDGPRPSRPRTSLMMAAVRSLSHPAKA